MHVESVDDQSGSVPRGPPTKGLTLGKYAPLELTTKGLPKRSWVKISQIRTLAAERIGKRVGRASPEQIAGVVEGLNEVIGA